MCYQPGKDGYPAGKCVEGADHLVKKLVMATCGGNEASIPGDGPYCDNADMPEKCCYSAPCPAVGRPLLVVDTAVNAKLALEHTWGLRA